MVNVAVVDTNIENIFDKYISKGQINIHDVDKIPKSHQHGSNVVELLLKECPTAHIEVFPILNESERGSIKKLCDVLEICINLNVSLINLSLGISNIIKKSNEKNKLVDLCRQARNKGIIIVAAKNNHDSSYPADLETVIGVGSYSDIDCAIKVDSNKKDIVFHNNFVFLNRDRNLLLKGNSYLAPIITGVLCNRLLEDKYLDLDGAINYIKYTIENKQNQLWIMSISNLEEKILHQKVAFLRMSELEDEKKIIEFYKKHTRFKSYKLTQCELIKKEIKNYHYLAIGIPDYDGQQECESLTQFLIDINCKVDIILTVPIISLSKRINKLENDNRRNIYSLYF